MTASDRCSLGPWNTHPGADPFGPPVAFDHVLAVGKPWSAHRSDRNGLNVDQDNVFGAATAPLATSKRTSEMPVARVRSSPQATAAEGIANRDYESLERLVLEHPLAA